MSRYGFDPSVNLGIDLDSFRLQQPGKYFENKGSFYGQQPINTPGKYAFMGTPEYKNATPEVQKLIAENALGNSSFAGVSDMLKGLRPTRADKQADLADALEFQRKQQEQTTPYNLLNKGLDTLSKLPEQISANAANRAMLNVLGATSVTDAFNKTMASYPELRFQSTVPLVQRNYFT